MDPIKERRVFAGIDWGGHEHQLCVVDADGRTQLELRVNHDVAGLKELSSSAGAREVQRCRKPHLRRVRCRSDRLRPEESETPPASRS